ncbi:Mobile element protein [Pseudomonas synxantha]|uniref:Mobile element protein n=1 Tax=Pseudomonas synxantha TaxID=47883 RepID=A0A3G7UE74_9PSED|nr:Mobile element protein [Pseudomonas synxantha]
MKISACNTFGRWVLMYSANVPTYTHLPPSQIVTRLTNKARYLAPEATFNRVLRGAGESDIAATPAQPNPLSHVL